MKKLALVLFIALVFGLGTANAAERLTWVDGDSVELGTAANPVYVTGGGGGAFTATTDGAYLDGDVTITGSLSADGAVSGSSFSATGAGEGVLSLDDSAAGSHDLTVSSDPFLYIDGVQAVGGEWSNTSDNSTTGSLDLGKELTVGGNAVIDFTDVTSEAQFQCDSTLAMDLTIDSGSASLSTAPMKIGTDLTTDGTDVFWKGTKLN